MQYLYTDTVCIAILNSSLNYYLNTYFEYMYMTCTRSVIHEKRAPGFPQQTTNKPIVNHTINIRICKTINLFKNTKIQIVAEISLFLMQDII